MVGKVTRRLLVAVVLVLGPFVGSTETLAQEPLDPVQRVHQLFAGLSLSESPGLAVAVVSNGELVFSDGYGLANLEHAIPITPSTVFDVASLSKQFTGLAIAMLVDQGRISLDDDVRRYIPELADFGAPITVGHLVHHTSGLRDWPGTLAVAGWHMHDVISYEQILEMAYGQRTLNFPPGSEYSYSNTGYVLLAELVARVTGQPFDAWTAQHVFQPLGMTGTGFHTDHMRVVSGRASGYSLAADGVRRTSPNSLTALGSSSLFSTAEDWARWLIELDRQRVGGPRVLELMRTRGVLNDGSAVPYAFGLIHGHYRGAATLSHSGSWASFQTYSVHFPELRLGVVVLANTTAIDVIRTAYLVADVFRDDSLGPAMNVGRMAEISVQSGSRGSATAVRPTSAPLDSALLREVSGVYVSEELQTTYEVEVEGQGLVMRHRRHGRIPLVQLGTDEFVPSTWFLSTVRFERDEGGRVTGLTMTAGQRNRDIRFTKVPGGTADRTD